MSKRVAYHNGQQIDPAENYRRLEPTPERIAEFNRSLEIIFDGDGVGHCLHSEAIELETIGTLKVSRASSVEFNGESQRWEVIGNDGVRLFAAEKRSACLEWEANHVDELRIHSSAH